MSVDQDFEDSARNLIKHCRSKSRGRDVSKEVIMDIGCGNRVYCGNAILKEYPDAAVIAIDRDPKIIRSVIAMDKKIECHLADIEKRDTLERFSGKMTKVFSIRAFQELTDIQTAFENVYYLLRPGGKAGIRFFSRSSTHEWFVELIKIPKWKDIYQDCFNADSFLSDITTEQYKEMVQKIGFEVVECSEKETRRVFETDTICRDNLYESFAYAFKVPAELLEEFKKEAFQIYEKVSERDAKGRLIDVTKNRTLILVKPTD